MTLPSQTGGAWRVDHDWLWRRPPGNDGTPASLRLEVRGPGAAAATAAWLGSLPPDETGVRGRGGWRVDGAAPGSAVAAGTAAAEVGALPDAGPDVGRLFLTSAGEDVAGGLDAAAREAWAQLGRRGTFALTWTPLPRPRG